MKVPLILLPILVATLGATDGSAQQAARSLPYSQNIPVPGGIAASARVLNITPPDRAVFVPELARQLYRTPDRAGSRDDRRLKLLHHLDTVATTTPSELVPIPLNASVWSESILRRTVGPERLLGAILADRNAAFLAYGLSSLDDETLAFMAQHPALLGRLAQGRAAVFAAYGRALHIANGRIVVPGGSTAVPLWEAAVGEPTAEPERFVSVLFDRHHGRLAYLYDAITSLDEPHARFALNAWTADLGTRRDRFMALVAITAEAFPEFDPVKRPLTRPATDVATMLARVAVEPDGTPSAPASRVLWNRVFAAMDRQRAPAESGDDGAIDAAWLADRILRRIRAARSDRLDAVSFAQRVFRNAPRQAIEDMVGVLGEFEHLRMLMLTLERMHITDPADYVRVTRRANTLTLRDREATVAALTQFQSALAIMAALRRVRILGSDAAARLLESLVSIDAHDDGYRCSVARWIDRTLLPTLPQSTATGSSVEDRVLSAIAGRGLTSVGPDALTTWEGQTYRVDRAGAELGRIVEIRSKLGEPTLDQVMAVAHAVERLQTAGAATAPADEAQRLADALSQIGSALAGDATPLPQSLAIDPDQVLRAAAALEHLKRPEDVTRSVSELVSLCDRLLADALRSIVYAIHLGDGAGPLLLGGNVARRHDLGLASEIPRERYSTAWRMPNVEITRGVPWHVRGSLLGLDIGLSSLALRHVSAPRVGGQATLNDAERKGFSDSVALLDPVDLSDETRDALAAALTRGQDQIRRLAGGTLDVEQVFADVHSIRVDGLRRRAIRWTLANDPANMEQFLSLSEILALGRPATGTFDAWGMSSAQYDSCLCSRMLALAAWQLFTGQPVVGLLHARMVDLHLRVIAVSAEIGVPGTLVRDILMAAMPDYLDDVSPADFDDWLTFVRTARAVSRERIETYMTALTSSSVLVPVTTRGTAR